jgi:hypothetical protein
MSAEETALIEAYVVTDTPVDRLPYSIEMRQLVTECSHRIGHPVKRRWCWRTLTNLRKSRKLPRLRS